MRSAPVITSPANPRLKSVVALRQRRRRDEVGLTAVEGREELMLALDAGARIRTLLYCLDLVNDASAATRLVDRAAAAGAEVLHLSRAAFEKVSYREGPDGILAVVPSPGRPLADLGVPGNALVLLAQAIEKPGNLGAMLRTADAAGVHAALAADPVTDWGNPNVVRSSKGTVFSVPVASATTPEAREWLRNNGIRIVATTPDAELRHTDADLTGPIAIAVGAEKWGLDDDLLAAAEIRVRIPMAGRADSLNAATSAAIVLYEAVRQRHHHEFERL